jgi:hypothetical protein
VVKRCQFAAGVPRAGIAEHKLGTLESFPFFRSDEEVLGEYKKQECRKS